MGYCLYLQSRGNSYFPETVSYKLEDPSLNSRSTSTNVAENPFNGLTPVSLTEVIKKSRSVKKAKSKPLVVGQSVQAKNLKRAARQYHYYVFYWDKETRTEDVEVHLKTFINRQFEIEAVNLNHSRFKAFRVSVDDSQEEVIVNPQNWPEIINVKRYYFPRNKTSNTAAIGQLPAIGTSSR